MRCGSWRDTASKLWRLGNLGAISRTEFVYLLEWPDTETMKERWAAFMSDQEWAEIKQVTAEAHGSLVGNIEDRTLELTDYSPSGQLTN